MMYRLPKTSECFIPIRARAIAAHRVPDEPPTRAPRDRPVVAIDIGDQIARDEILKISGGDGTRVHRAVVDGFGIGQHDNHFLSAFGEGALDGLGHVNFLRPLTRADEIAVQRINHWIAAGLTGRISRRQEDEHLAIGILALQIAFERCTMDFDPVHRNRFCAWLNRGNFGFHLGGRRQRDSETEQNS